MKTWTKVSFLELTTHTTLKFNIWYNSFYSSVFNNTSIDLNSILALVLIGILFLVTQGGTGGLFGGSAYNRNSYQSYDYSDYGGYGDNQFYKRSDAYFDNGELNMKFNTGIGTKNPKNEVLKKI